MTISLTHKNRHCLKSVRIRSYSGTYFPAFWLNTERCKVSLHIQSECGKIRTRITPNTVTFYAVRGSNSSSQRVYLNLGNPKIRTLISYTSRKFAEPYQITNMELFAKLISGLRLLTIFTKYFILDVWQGSSADQINGLGLYDRDLRHEKVNSSKATNLKQKKLSYWEEFHFSTSTRACCQMKNGSQTIYKRIHFKKCFRHTASSLLSHKDFTSKHWKQPSMGAVIKSCSLKYAANSQENAHAGVWFQ